MPLLLLRIKFKTNETLETRISLILTAYLVCPFSLFIISLCYFKMLTGARRDDYSAAQLPTRKS